MLTPKVIRIITFGILKYFYYLKGRTLLKLAICMLNQMFLEKQIHATKNYARK